MLAAEALPDGAITLDAAMLLTWCNQTDSEHIGLSLQADRGHSIFNILRAPAFARYARQASWPGPILLHMDKLGKEQTLLVTLTRYGLDPFMVVTRDLPQVEKLVTPRHGFVANKPEE